MLEGGLPVSSGERRVVSARVLLLLVLCVAGLIASYAKALQSQVGPPTRPHASAMAGNGRCPQPPPYP